MQQRKCIEEFKREAVCIVTTRGQSLSSVVSDLGSGTSTRKRWRQMRAEHDLLSGPHEDMRLERARGRKDNALLHQERDLPKKATAFFVQKTRRCSLHASLRRRPRCLWHACARARVSASVVTMHENSVRPVAAS